MKVGDRVYRTIWLADDGWAVQIVDQTKLPHRFDVIRLESLEVAAVAIQTMQVRGAPLIGATAAYGVALGMREDPSDGGLERACDMLAMTRPTAVNLHWALQEMRDELSAMPPASRMDAAYGRAARICDNDVAICDSIGNHGLKILKSAAADKGDGPLQILTHCNAGWLACIDWGTALAPIYKAHDAGIPVHVWVDETRPRNQGAALTAWELHQHGVPHTVIVDNAGGHLMQKGQVDLCLVGTDRTTAHGHVANKIGTYLKALAAKDNGIPFYVALPSTTIDWSIADGGEIPIEQREPQEITHVTGRLEDGGVAKVQISSPGSPAMNPSFDVTPNRLVSELITERGPCPASRAGLLSLFPERAVEVA